MLTEKEHENWMTKMAYSMNLAKVNEQNKRSLFLRLILQEEYLEVFQEQNRQKVETIDKVQGMLGKIYPIFTVPLDIPDPRDLKTKSN